MLMLLVFGGIAEERPHQEKPAITNRKGSPHRGAFLISRRGFNKSKFAISILNEIKNLIIGLSVLNLLANKHA